MSASITLRSRYDAIDEYIQRNFVDNTTYAFSGRSFPWDNETSPDVVYSDEKTLLETRQAMIYLMKLSETDVIKAIKRFDWETGIVYTQVEHDSEYSDFNKWVHPKSPFYVMNSVGNVYKCISNNYGAVSTDEPTGQSTDLTLTADGYIWKFMYDLTTAVSNKFLTDEWLPVPEDVNKSTAQNSVEGAAIDGGIEFIRVDVQGNDYSGIPTIEIIGDGTGCEATAIINSGQITAITVTNPGSGYTFAEINIYSVNGSGCEAQAMISPPGGHGSNAVFELGAFFLAVGFEFQGDSNGYPAVSTFRNNGLIRNPLKLDSSPVTEDTITTLNIIDIEFASGDFANNEKVIGEDSQAYGYVYYDEPGDDTSIWLYNMHGTFIEGEIIHGQQSEVNATYHDANTSLNEVDLTSGLVLYRENIQFITRNSLQIEKFVYTIEF